jgi:hypothetical protein
MILLNLLPGWIKLTVFPHFLVAALNDLFGHYADAWKTWFKDLFTIQDCDSYTGFPSHKISFTNSN